jgi:UDP-3-O-[3-hydroxymyristoyl] glucosamine N-acyltransferase
MPTLSDIADWVGAERPTNAEREVTGAASLDGAESGDVSFMASVKFLDQLKSTRALAVLVPMDFVCEGVDCVLLHVAKPELAMAKVLERLAPAVYRPEVGISAKADVHPTANVAADARIGAFVSVGPRCEIGAGVVLHPGVRLGADVKIGASSELFCNVVVYDRCTIGDRVILHAGTVIGADGFGYRWDGERHVKMPHIGVVEIGNDVEIGANSCIDRAKFSKTVIGPGTKIDNLVQVGHNVVTGAHCLLVGCTGIGGSTTLGNGVVVAGGVGVVEQIKLGDGAMVSAMSLVTESVEPGARVGGIPAVSQTQNLRQIAGVQRLPETLARIRAIEKKLDAST